jgi:hypothetical protein
MPGILDLGDVLELIMMVSIIERFLSKRRSDNGIGRFFMFERSLVTTNEYRKYSARTRRGIGRYELCHQTFPEQLFD